MRLPREAYPLVDAVATFLPTLTDAQRRGLTWWVMGTILGGSACQTAVIAALLPVCGVRAAAALRQALREWLFDGADKVATCRAQVNVAACFPGLLGWVVRWWHGTALALAVDATALGDRVVVLSVSVLYRGTALPVAWHVLPANQPGSWMPPILDLLTRLGPAVPPGWTVVVLADRGLWSPRLWTGIRAHGWHPLLRIRPDATFRPTDGQRVPARTLVAGPGHAWVGAGVAFGSAAKRQAATLIVVWDADQTEPWLVLTDLPPADVGPAWYGLRTWIELGFRALKRMGWHGERTRRTDPDRIARHGLVLAVATLWVVATGTREEDAARVGREPANLRVAVAPRPAVRPRTVSVFARGLVRLRWQLLRVRRLWTQLWLWPEPWPALAATVRLTVVPALPS